MAQPLALHPGPVTVERRRAAVLRALLHAWVRVGSKNRPTPACNAGPTHGTVPNEAPSAPSA